MPQLTLSIQYAKNTGLVLNATELANLYFTGIPLQDQYGNPIPEETVNFFIEAATKEICDYLSIKPFPTCIKERRDFMYDDFIHWGYMPTTYPVHKAVGLKGFLNNNQQVQYPTDWICIKTQSPDKDLYHRNFTLVPTTGTAAVYSSTPYFLSTPWSAVFNGGTLPNYFELNYITGSAKLPPDIMRAIGMMSSISIFQNLSDIISGTPGISGKSIGIDGLNQNMTTTAAGGRLAFSGRIDSYRNELKDTLLPNLKSRYVGNMFVAL